MVTADGRFQLGQIEGGSLYVSAVQAVPRLQPARLSVPRARLALTGVYRVRVHFEMSAISASAAGFRGPRGPYLRRLTPELSVDKLNASAICWSAYQNRRKWLWGSRGEQDVVAVRP